MGCCDRVEWEMAEMFLVRNDENRAIGSVWAERIGR